MPARGAATSLLLPTLLTIAGLGAHATAGEIQPDESPAAAEETQASRDLSPLLAPIVERHKVPGMVAAVVRGDEPVALGAAGVRRMGSAEKVTVEDRFHVGSCTKSMTATLVAMLVE